MLYTFFRMILIVLFKLLFRFRVSGKKHIPKKGGFILASNHLSYLDPLALGVACPRNLNFMARHDLFFHRFFSRLILNVGAFPVKRGKGDVSAFREALRRLNLGKPLVVFPEGSRAFDGMGLEVQPGIGFLAAKTGVPIIPAFISGSGKALPRGAKFIRLGRVSVKFGEQISIERSMPYQEIARCAMEGIRHLSCSDSA